MLCHRNISDGQITGLLHVDNIVFRFMIRLFFLRFVQRQIYKKRIPQLHNKALLQIIKKLPLGLKFV